MAQTAVEWLEKICQDRGYFLMSEYFEQAKEMEKEQMIDFAYKALTEAHFDSHRQCNVEKLYKETYNK